ncbi:helix-turn-helix transcriptional regulator [Alteromonadaceae bacterium BrNp21-10]|nr:helix-turn-helix transcriptional regulator [Alteromonadaceae bacterium BrNp21-10]
MQHQWEDILELGAECNERFLIQDNLSLLSSLAVGFAGISSLAGRYHVARRKPDYHTILFTTEGRGKLLTAAGTQAIEANTVTLLPIGQPFHFSLDSTLWKTAWFCLDDDPIWQHLHYKKASVKYCENTQAIYHLLGHLYYENDRSMQETSINQIKRYLQQTVGHNTVVEVEQSVQLRRLATLFDDIQRQLHAPWTIESMAKRVHYSAPHLHRLCQQTYAQSPIQRLIFLRIERAKQLLTDTDWSLIQIANTVGYHDVFNFSTRFKKSVGISPSHFRQQQS